MVVDPLLERFEEFFVAVFFITVVSFLVGLALVGTIIWALINHFDLLLIGGFV